MTVKAEEHIRSIRTPRDGGHRPRLTQARPDPAPAEPLDSIDALAQRPAIRGALALVSRLERNWPLSVAVILGAVAALSFL